MPLSKNLKRTGSFSRQLKDYTTFKIGGPARFLYRPANLKELRELVTKYRAKNPKLKVLGAGSNLLVSDKGINSAVIKLDSPAFCGISHSNCLVKAGAGCLLNRLLAYCSKHGLSGLEFLAGIPGTVGGALAMNAGVSVNAEPVSIGDYIESVTVLDYNSNLKVLDRAKLKFAYRRSNLARYIILGVSLRTAYRGPGAVEKNISRYLGLRRNSQDYTRPNAGCVFMNPPGDSAGRLIDSCGLKGRRVGGAEVSRKHANFILNADQATSENVLALIRLVRKEVKKKYGITLEPEIKVWK
jgi:UDP-N-acetylmuramate dehydrogenase